MALLHLKDIGKIYVSESNVAVGIRGVNLSFEKGEFVAITGKSGSGKSTLLNVISGMDTYEEGELFIEDQPTSHYLQPDWEEYREKYISFIFQDYNIIESMTVLQNVELALMHIEDTKQRRKRALDLIDRVGMTSHKGQKGSRLSGGQKQRTVIARALAKDSPIILADEPTGNLDSHTSEEIINLLKEVSQDKLLIVVTHNFEQVEAHATRHIRIFDGSVESDTVICAPKTEPTNNKNISKNKPPRKNEWKKNLKDGLLLGKTIFAAKPRLSVFLCLLMIIGTFGVFMITILCGESASLFDSYYMFRHIDGRVIVTTQNGEVISEEKLASLAEKYGAESWLRVDSMLDTGSSHFTYPKEDVSDYPIFMNAIYGSDYGKPDIGTYPKAENEVFLYLPISYQPDFGKDTLLIEEIKFNNLPLKVSGVRYYYDNNLRAECLFTEKGFRTITALNYLINKSSLSVTLSLTAQAESSKINIYGITPSFDSPADKIYINERYQKAINAQGKDILSNLQLVAIYYRFNYFYEDEGKSMMFSETFNDDTIVYVSSYQGNEDFDIIISDEILTAIASEVLDRSYKQASLFFKSDKQAHAVAEQIKADGYVAVPSDTEYVPSAGETIGIVLSGVMMAVIWFVCLLFLAFFINLCSGRALDAFKGDMAIMRSMGIPVSVIRIAMYTRMMISIVPSFIVTAASAVLIFTSPKFNSLFVYLYPWQYAVIALGMILLTAKITQKQVHRLFGESVKKSLKGDHAQ